MSVNAMTIKGIITGIGFAPQDGKDGIYGLHQVGMQSSSSLQIARYF